MIRPFAEFTIRCNSAGAAAYKIQTGEEGISLPDPIATAILLDPALSLHASNHLVEVEVASDLTRGMTVVARLGVTGDDRNRKLWEDATASSVCWKLDVPGWKSSLINSLRS